MSVIPHNFFIIKAVTFTLTEYDISVLSFLIPLNYCIYLFIHINGQSSLMFYEMKVMLVRSGQVDEKHDGRQSATLSSNGTSNRL